MNTGMYCSDVLLLRRCAARSFRGALLLPGRWTVEEHDAFVQGLKLYGREWKKVSSLVSIGFHRYRLVVTGLTIVLLSQIPSRTVVQIRTHAQKYFQKLAKEQGTDGKDNDSSAKRGRPRKKNRDDDGESRASKKQRQRGYDDGDEEVPGPHLVVRHR